QARDGGVGELQIRELLVSRLEIFVERCSQEEQAREVRLAGALDHVLRRPAEGREARFAHVARKLFSDGFGSSREAERASSVRRDLERSERGGRTQGGA